MENIIAIVGLVVLVGNLVISILYPLVVVFINYVARCDFKPSKFEKWKGVKLGWEWDNVVFIEMMVYVIGGLITLIILKEGGVDGLLVAVYYLISLLILICSLPVMRWLVDVARNLKVTNKTGDSERLLKIEKEMAEFMKRQEG
jgi:hypothetical protein